MSIVATTPEQAREEAQSINETIRTAAITFLSGVGGTARLHDLLLHLRADGSPDDAISRALAGLIAEDKLKLTAQRSVVLIAA